MKLHLPFKILTISTIIALIVPLSIQDGMFMDGQIYACVSNNLANGIGSLWFFKFSDTYMPLYSEQLPMFFWIQSVFFKTLGSSIYTERIFSFLMALITAYLISKTWKLLFNKNESLQTYRWLPVLLWISVPVCSWGYIHNIEEVLMGVFSVSAIYFSLKALLLKQHVVINLLIAGVFTFCCSFCKGVQGLFPIVTIGVYWLFVRDFSLKRMLVLSGVLLLMPLLIYTILLLNDTSFESIANNINNRIVRTFTQDKSATTGNRLYLIYRLFTEHLPAIGLIAITLIIYYSKHKSIKVNLNKKLIWFFVGIGISGSFPLIATMEQRGFYLITTLPFFAIALSLVLIPYLEPLVKKINTSSSGFKLFKGISFIVLIGVILVSTLQYGKTKRDKDKLHDVYMIGATIPRQSIVTVTPEIIGDYGLYAYFVRHYNISLDLHLSDRNDYILTTKGSNTEIPNGYQKMELDLVKYDFFVKNQQ